jgi:hypothetical protein
MENRLKEESKHIEIPKNLDQIVKLSISKGKRVQLFSRRIKRSSMGLAASLLLTTCIIGIGVNTSPVFAEAVSEIPVLSPLAKIMTLSTYQIEDDNVELSVEVPEVNGLDDKILEARINLAIQKRIEEANVGIQERAAEYKKAYFETGGTKEGFRPIQAQVGYEVKAIGEKYMSFLVYQFESLASAYTDFTYYNFDLVENREVTLEDIFGDKYQNIINNQVSKQIEVLKQDPKNAFFEGDMGFIGIKENQSFFINENGKVVICFAKYEIAPGSQGRVEITIQK